MGVSEEERRKRLEQKEVRGWGRNGFCVAEGRRSGLEVRHETVWQGGEKSVIRLRETVEVIYSVAGLKCYRWKDG